MVDEMGLFVYGIHAKISLASKHGVFSELPPTFLVRFAARI